eukprot:TRINITY_DN6049_c0_g1_i1.p1 TRINITY_DN6049_c0_g1~~TRINITY_DN6049_c0_g1_i1.p1  ORF type:complete len:322 (+),score=65.21 TRINITY_DN6049_c0_g1_i1:126-1091(+)
MQAAYRTAAFILYGSSNFTRPAFLKSAQSFDPKDTEGDLSASNVIITGANAGIGRSAATALASKGATVYAICRNEQRGQAAVDEIRAETGNPNVHLEVVDMSSLEQVRAYARKFEESGKPLHVLVNNAGVMEHERQITKDGLEMNFAVNVAGVVSLTELLLPALERAAPNGKVISVATGGILTEPLDRDFQMEKVKKLDGTMAYARNKRIQLAVTERWAEIYGKQKGVGFYAMHPGWVDTVLLQRAMPGFHKTFKGGLRSPEEGADTITWLAMQPNARLTNGAFYFDRKESKKHLPGAGTTYTEDAAREVYAAVRKLSGLT